jgi:hypothetical protein
MVTKEILTVIRKAIEDPELYSSGTEKNELRAAFDALISQVYAALFGKEPASRINARIKLNNSKRKSHSSAEWNIILLLREALKESETSLFAAGYTEHVADIEAFIKNHLKSLYDALA